jgi:hypothetical protein
MRYFIDEEFVDDSKTIDLISIGIVAEDGREYYKQNIAFFGRALYDPKDTPRWIVENVFPHLSDNPLWWCDRSVMKAEILVFMDIEKYGKPELWGYYSAYDHVAFCQLFGTMMDLPKGYPMLTYDLRQWLDMHGMQDVRQPDDSVHNALIDARWVAETYRRLVK